MRDACFGCPFLIYSPVPSPVFIILPFPRPLFLYNFLFFIFISVFITYIR